MIDGPSEALITGAGVMLSSGTGSEEAWLSLAHGTNKFGPHQRLNAQALGYSAAAHVAPFDLELRRPKNEKFMGASVRIAMKAAAEAVNESKIDLDSLNSERFAIYVGSGHTGLDGTMFFRAMSAANAVEDADLWARFGGRPSRLVDPFFGLRTLSNAGAGLLSLEFNAGGPSNNYVQGEVAGAHAIAAALGDLRDDRCDVALAGGFDSLLMTSSLLTFHQAGLLSRQGPETAYRPFDQDRDGLVLGEGAGFLILEREEDVRARGGQALARLVGVGASISLVDRPGPAMCADALRRALEQGRIDLSEEVAFVVARGLGTLDEDAAEARALGDLLRRDMPVTAMKGSTGFLGAATAAVELCLTTRALRQGMVPPIAGLLRPDPNCGVDLVIGAVREIAETKTSALCFSHAFSGQTAVMKIERV